MSGIRMGQRQLESFKIASFKLKERTSRVWRPIVRHCGTRTTVTSPLGH